MNRKVARTPWGQTSGALSFGRLAGVPVVFLARHGYGHTIAPHDINYRANVWALRELQQHVQAIDPAQFSKLQRLVSLLKGTETFKSTRTCTFETFS